MSIRIVVSFLAACAACAANGQSPAPSVPPAQPPEQTVKQQTPSQKVATACWNKRRLAIRAVNLKYIALTQDAAALFLKENKQARADDANTWIKNLAWANDANLKGLTPDAQDRLGTMQAAYLKERVTAIITADNASVDDVEAASKTALQGGDQASAVELAKLEDRIKQELRSINKAAAPTAPASRLTAATKAAPTPASQPASQPNSGHPFGVQGNNLNPGSPPP